MLKELKLSNELKHKTSFGDIEGIAFVVNHITAKVKLSSLLTTCNFENTLHINVKAVIGLLEYIDLIEVVEIEDSDIYHDYLIIQKNELLKYQNQKWPDMIQSIAEKIFSNLLNEKDFNEKALYFDPLTGNINIKNNAFPLHYAIFRNLFVALGVLNKISEATYSINKEINKNIIHNIRKLSLKKLEEKLEAEKQRGLEAELFVLNFEKNRIPTKAESIIQISNIDVTAGYDIISYMSKDSMTYDRFIEVKCYLGDPHFIWSINERNKAKKYDNNYFLYIVDYKKMHNENYVPIILSNPYKEITDASSNWVEEASSWMVKKIMT